MKNEHKSNLWLPLSLLVLLVALASWYYVYRSPRGNASEQTATSLQLAGPIAEPNAELSGLAWHGDTLILLPQYPDRFGANDGALFALSKADILAAVDGTLQTPLEPASIHLNAPGLTEMIVNFQGFEAIAFHGDQIFLTIESGEGTDMRGYLVSGQISADGREITLDTSKIAEIPVAFPSENHTDEAIIIENNSILTFFEVNGARLNHAPVAHVFDLNLNPQGTISFPNIEYRVTDAALDSDNTFWVINYFFPGDLDLAASDPLAEKYGEGQTHAQHEQVERLVEMDYSPSGITLSNSAPIQLKLDGDNARNIEGIALLDEKGFLLVTDKFPSTLFLFVARP